MRRAAAVKIIVRPVDPHDHGGINHSGGTCRPDSA